MSKITKKELQYQINGLAAEASTRHNSIMRIHRALASIGVDIFSDDFDLTEPEPQLKQLDQSVFNGLDEKWRFAAVDKCGEVWCSTHKTQPSVSGTHLSPEPNADSMQAEGYYDASNWQNSLIERDIAKELLEADLSSELTGSDYFYSNITSALLESGSKLVVCFVSNLSESDALDEKHIEVITSVDTEFNDSDGYGWQYAVPINNQGEPLTASEVGL